MSTNVTISQSGESEHKKKKPKSILAKKHRNNTKAEGPSEARIKNLIVSKPKNMASKYQQIERIFERHNYIKHQIEQEKAQYFQDELEEHKIKQKR